MQVNKYLANMSKAYLFADIAQRVNAYQQTNPSNTIIKLGIGDVTQPLAPYIAEQFSKAALNMATKEGFHGYAPDGGYPFLIDAILENDYKKRNITFERNEVFISDGAKSDVSNLQELFDKDCVIAVTDPVYPVYVDSNGMAGRLGNMVNGAYERLITLPCTKENDFVPQMPKDRVDVLYLCYPNNPTGTVLTKAQLQKIVNWANENECLIVYDAAYKGYISNDDIPRSIYEVEGAKTCAIECSSFSKTAGFTGVRCAYTVIPKELKGKNGATSVSINALFRRRMETKFNGVSFPVQCAAKAVFDEQGQAQIKQIVAGYMHNAALIYDGLKKAGFTVFGGENAPYIWMKTPNNMTSWAFFDALLQKAQVVGTPGAGFGISGEGYFRLTAFNTLSNTQEAIERIIKAF